MAAETPAAPKGETRPPRHHYATSPPMFKPKCGTCDLAPGSPAVFARRGAGVRSTGVLKNRCRARRALLFGGLHLRLQADRADAVRSAVAHVLHDPLLRERDRIQFQPEVVHLDAFAPRAAHED